MNRNSSRRARIVPPSWKLKRIDDVAKTGSGGTPLSTRTEYYDGGTIPWINSSEVNGHAIRKAEKYITEKGLSNSSARIFPRDSVLIALYGATAGRCSRLEIEASTNQAVCAILPNESYDSQFLKYYIDTLYEYLVGISTGSARDNLSQDGIKQLAVAFPSLDEQKKIAALLSVLDAKIELNNRTNRELEALAKTIYDYWFVQFEFPDANGRPYKTSDGKMTYNTQLKRQIPADWEVHRLGSILHTSLGGTPSTEKDEYWKDGEYHWLNSGEVAEFPVITSELKITQKGIAKSATELLPSGTTLLSITRHLRPTILAIDACVNQSVVGIRETETIKHYFIYPFVKNEIPRLMTLRTGAQQPHINKDTVDHTLIAIPTSQTNLLCRYNRSVEGIYKQIFNIACQNRQLAALRDWLLPMLMNGQVTVK